jgi:serine/threonine-protein kinase
MHNEDWIKVEELLNAALELEPTERRKFLEEIGASAPDLRREVESLLVYEEKVDGFLDTPALAFSADFFDDDHAPDARVGQEIGHYRILRELGRGGMGAVFLAERADGAFEQDVALKVMRYSFPDSELARRFSRERQILASLNHPNIARLLDGGVSATREPFLVMEYVEGLRIDDYCDERNLSTNERLQLFLKVCRAVSYAHQHLVVHRDIKPSNIIVVEDEQRKPTPKLLDFGIAKLLDAEQAGEHTQTEMRAFTPNYASPEQISGGQITTASDVYSLGVLLQDLLRGARPSTNERKNRGDSVAETPGQKTLITNLPTDQSEENKRAKTSVRRFADAELENIISMARREDPARRYASAAQLAEDVQRYLDGLPVHAQKDSFTYRAGKFVRRNKVGVAAAAIILLTIVSGIIATIWQARRANEQAWIAAQERDRARVEAAKAERINAFLQNILGFSDTNWLSPNPDKKRDATIADALDEASRRAESELAGQPEVLASVWLTIGRAYMVQSRLDAAEIHLRAAVDIRRSVFGTEHQDTAQALVTLGELYIPKGNYGEAESLLREAVSIYRRARDAGNVSEKWFPLALTDLGIVQNYKGESAASEASLLEALEVSANFTGADRAGRANMYANLALARRGQGDLDGAIAYQEKAIEELGSLPGKPSSEWGVTHANLAFYVMMKGDYARSEALFQKALSFYHETVGEMNQMVSYARINFADNYYAQGNYRRAREEIDRAIAIQRQLLPDGHVDYGLSYTVLGKVLTRTNDLKVGESYFRHALEARTRALKAGHRWTAETQSALGENLTAQKRYGEAEPLLIESHNILKASLGQQDPRTQEARRRLINLYEAWKKPEMAARLNQPDN